MILFLIVGILDVVCASEIMLNFFILWFVPISSENYVYFTG